MAFGGADGSVDHRWTAGICACAVMDSSRVLEFIDMGAYAEKYLSARHKGSRKIRRGDAAGTGGARSLYGIIACHTDTLKNCCGALKPEG